MSAEIVPVDNMAALDTLDPQTREIAVTRMLGEARSWLAHSVEATEPVEVANFKAYIATVAESTKQLNLSKEIQLDATEMIRRAERALGLAIRKGQDEGTVATTSVARRQATLIRDQKADSNLIPTVRDVAPDFYNNGMEIGRLADNFTDDEFEEAVSRAKEEGNVSRANVLRKGEEVKTGAEHRAEKWERVEALATEGHTSRQIASLIGANPEALRAAARERGIAIPADRARGKVRRLDSDRILSGVAESLSAATFSLQQIDPLDLDQETAHEQVDSLTESLTALRRAVRTIKESI